MATNNASDLRGVGRLTVDAIVGITDLVEEMHLTISRVVGLFGPPVSSRTNGITGLVYRNLRNVSSLVGTGIDAVLGQMANLLGERYSPPSREAVLAVLNGVLGDHLAASDNSLALSMQLRRNGEKLDPEDPNFVKALEESKGKIVLMIHGSCMNDLQWKRDGHDHGAALARDQGFLPIYLLYNSGLHISENGRLFTELMESLIHKVIQPLELFIIGHSMGGLVTRSAFHYGKLAGHSWMEHVRKIIFLGAPHHGAPLERGGNWIDLLLKISPYSAPFSRLGKIRSAGVTDMRYGNVLDDDWQGRDRFEPGEDGRTAVPLPSGVTCYAIAATIGKEASTIGDHCIGDGLVTVNSALGRNERADLNLSIPDEYRWICREIHHLELLNDPRVYDTISKWLQS